MFLYHCLQIKIKAVIVQRGRNYSLSLSLFPNIYPGNSNFVREKEKKKKNGSRKEGSFFYTLSAAIAACVVLLYYIVSKL